MDSNGKYGGVEVGPGSIHSSLSEDVSLWLVRVDRVDPDKNIRTPNQLQGSLEAGLSLPPNYPHSLTYLYPRGAIVTESAASPLCRHPPFRLNIVTATIIVRDDTEEFRYKL